MHNKMSFRISLFLLTLSLPGLSSAQTTGKALEPRIYSDTLEFKGTSADIYKHALDWITQTFKSASEVLEIQDPEQGVLLIKGQSIFQIFLREDTLEVPLHFTLSIRAMDNAYRYHIDDIFLNCYPGNPEIQIPFEILYQPKDLQQAHIRKTIHQYYPDISETESEALLQTLEMIYPQCRSKGEGNIRGIIGLLTRYMHKQAG